MNKKEKFIQNVKDFFKYDDSVSINTDFDVLEFKVDMTIGDSIFIEVYSNRDGSEQVEKMKKISLANTWFDIHEELCTWHTNDYKKQKYEYKEYDGFVTYDFEGGLFIKILDINCMTWIPLVYRYYEDFPSGYEEDPKPYNGKTEDLIELNCWNV